MIERQQMIDKLVGVQSSKQNYYTQLKRSISELQKKNTQLEIINDVMKSFNVEMSMDEMLRNILGKLQKIYSFNRLSLCDYNKEKEKLHVTNLYPQTTTYKYIGAYIPLENSLYWEVIESKIYKDYKVEKQSHYIEHSSFKSLHLKQVLIFPLYAKGNIIGTFSLGSKEVVQYDDTELSFFQQLSDQLAVSMENVRLFQRVLHGKKEWEQTFSAVMDIILLVDLNGNILRMNQAGEELLEKHKIDENKYKNINHLLYGNLLENNSIIEKCIETKEAVYEELKWGANEYYEVYAYPVFNEKSELFHIITYMKDVTKKRYYEVQLLQSSKLAAIGEMAAGVAHELNNPLTAILGNAQLLLRKTSINTISYELLHDVFECGKRCQNIVRNLLTFSRQDEYLFEKCSINLAVKRVLSLIGYQIKQQNIKIKEELDEQIELVDGSIQQIEQVIINFLLNAKDALLDAAKPNKEITIQTRQCAQWVYLSIIDNGIGISQNGLQNIFDPFFTTKNEQKGTGLGLSVSLGIAESHQGEIVVKSTLNKGSKFTLKLPKIKESL